MLEAIVLAGGKGLRLKGHTEVPKPFLIIRGQATLFDAQIEWLVGHGFEHIIVAISRENFKYLRRNYSRYLNIALMDFSIEEEYLGTAGALKKALYYVEEPKFYVFNVDDVVFYDPRLLFKEAKNYNAILVKKAKLPFGTVEVDKYNRVVKFEEKPEINKLVSCGHYVFRKDLIEDILEERGDLERTLLNTLAEQKLLFAYELKDKWFSLNTYKDLKKIRKELGLK